MTFFEAFFAMSEHVCHFGTQLFAISEHGLFRNGNHLVKTAPLTSISCLTFRTIEWRLLMFVWPFTRQRVACC